MGYISHSGSVDIHLIKQLDNGGKNQMSQSNKTTGELRPASVGSKPCVQTLEKEGLALPHTENAGRSAMVLIRPKIHYDPITKRYFILS